jgi:hypothetical protein
MRPSRESLAYELPPTDEPADSFADRSARVRAWRRTRDPRTLWPRLEPDMLQPSADAIGSAVGALLRGNTATLGAPDGHDAYAIGIAALLSGTGPLLGRWVEQGSLDVSDALARVLVQHLAHGRARAERITRGLTAPLAALVAAGVTPVVIKGFHTAHVYFAEPGLRPMADVDLVVALEEIPAAEESLRGAGFIPSPLVVPPHKRNWYPPEHDERLWSFEMFDARDGWQLDLHDGLNLGHLANLGFQLDGGVHLPTPWHVNGIPVYAAKQPMLTVILATHLSAELHARCLLRVVELLFVIRRDRELGLLDWDSLEALLDESGSRRFVYPALSLVERLVPGTIDSGLLSRARRASTALARVVTDRLTPTCPILDDRPILAERLMWITSGRQAIQAIANWLNPVPGRPWREMLTLYHSRFVRLLAGRVSWIVGRERP